MIYIILKMSKFFGVNQINNGITITDYYPNENDIIKSLEKASYIHKEVRRHLQNQIKPNIKLLDIAKIIENKTKELSLNFNKSINNGIGFPVGLAINSCAAHFHPEANDNIILKKDDIIKIDFGTEVNGWIIDSAFSLYFNEKHNNLANAVKEATYLGIKNAGVDVDINDWSKDIKEVMESYNINPIINLGGHNIERGIIHAGMFLPASPTDNLVYKKFTEGVFAIETFGSTGDNYVNELGESTLYRINPNVNVELKLDSTKKFYNKIKNNFKTLPFTNRYIDDINNYKTHLDVLKKNNMIYSYPPLCVNNGYTAQYEHTIHISENKKIVFSQGEDY